MTKNKKLIIITLLAVCCVVTAVWAIMRYHARRELVGQFNSDLALRFDDIMETTYPLIDQYAAVILERADSIDVIAGRANANKDLKYSDAFSVMWEQYLKTSVAKKAFNIMGEYEYLKVSPVFQMLTNSGDKRQEEANALQKMSIAGVMLKEPYFLGYDSVKSVSKTAKRYIEDGLKVMEPYHSNQTDIQGWRKVTPQKYFKMFEKYNK